MHGDFNEKAGRQIEAANVAETPTAVVTAGLHPVRGSHES
jgi:hypothetical protein